MYVVQNYVTPTGRDVYAEWRDQLRDIRAKTYPRDRNHDDSVVELFRADPAVAVYLLIALRQMTKAFGGVAAVAEKADLNPTQLYRTLSEEGNPSLSSLAAILKSMGLRLAVQRDLPDAA